MLPGISTEVVAGSKMADLVIAGSGVIGLSVAFELLQSPGLQPARIHIIAQHFPGEEPISHEFTSPWAGAHFRPFPHRPESFGADRRESGYTRVTYKRMKTIAAEHPESTIEFMKGADYLEQPPSEYDGMSPGYNKDSLENFREIPKGELPPNVKSGFEYTTYCLNAPEYLGFLQRQVTALCKAKGVELCFKRMTLRSLAQVYEVVPSCDVIFNCTGLGLQLDGSYDPSCFAIRGQTLLLDVPHKTKFAAATVTHQGRDGNWTFVIKRPPVGGKPAQYILGGTKQPGDNCVTPRDMDSHAIMERARALYPELLCESEFSVARVNVGFRPARNGGSRVELESASPGPVIHAYGLGGMGYETSLGVAEHCLRIYRGLKCQRSKAKL
ncbi:FAD-dependent oxidoreductase [Lachancea thermotolerans CBS 6340]|uniref:KLTH0A02772p n=1 Tax=Lachancea thermotolerans (strain ATCC 56472 / CBS 6340 / NRRL Y-8284) TaxID=559295 RepID=C5DBH9_LACTC|nr:KLTH0A02772p [Lachancea thermotolerans CBS 6340]CAR21136.1 KLTH0A02772p [Lachancea thermotolerans CBS 6340]